MPLLNLHLPQITSVVDSELSQHVNGPILGSHQLIKSFEWPPGNGKLKIVTLRLTYIIAS